MDRDLAGRESILNVILDVHMRNTGALETCKEDQLRDLKILKTRYFNWEPSVGCGGKYEKFDDAVKDLLNWEPSVGCGGKYEKFDNAVKDLLLEVNP